MELARAESFIGEIITNNDPTKQDLANFNDGIYIYYLCNGQSFSAVSFPLLALKLPTNFVPNYSDRVLRHIPNGSGKNIGDAEADAIKTHSSTVDNFTPTAQNTTATNQQEQITWAFQCRGRQAGNILDAITNITRTAGSNVNAIADSGASSTRDVMTFDEVHTHIQNPHSTTINQISGLQAQFNGASETTMKNRGIQFYIKMGLV